MMDDVKGKNKNPRTPSLPLFYVFVLQERRPAKNEKPNLGKSRSVNQADHQLQALVTRH